MRLYNELQFLILQSCRTRLLKAVDELCLRLSGHSHLTIALVGVQCICIMLSDSVGFNLAIGRKMLSFVRVKCNHIRVFPVYAALYYCICLLLVVLLGS